ncbi:MAG TPA: hypothetical protein VL400_11695 [Polyangiaceae bacterium]|jgi:hypothetical protein|nr:hypothetical protein [Polyangiaceae bacterium]
MNDNPFDAFDLDPLAPPDALTERFREIVEDAPDPAPARAAWELLTLHPHRRIRFALSTFVDDEAPSSGRVTAARSAPVVEPRTPPEIDARHLLPLPRLSDHSPTTGGVDPIATVSEDPLLDEDAR